LSPFLQFNHARLSSYTHAGVRLLPLQCALPSIIIFGGCALRHRRN